MIPVEPPYEVRHRAWECALVLTEDFSDRLTLEQLVRMHVLVLMSPDRIGWSEIGDALSLYSLVVEVRV